MRLKHAFTLIELLVVIVIISILSAMLLPVVNQAKAKSKHTVCILHGKQLAQAFLMYASDNDDYTALVLRTQNYKSANSNISLVQFRLWGHDIFPYVNKHEVFLCPLDTEETFLDKNGNGRFSKKNQNYEWIWANTCSYGYNGRYLSPGMNVNYPNEAPHKSLPISAYTSHSQTVLFAESIFFAPVLKNSKVWGPPTGFHRVYPPSNWTREFPENGLSYGHFWPRHNTKFGTVIFLDAHVKPMTPHHLDDENLWNGQGVD